MQNNQTIGQVVIVGGGPVGNFTAVLVGMLGVACTVYQKRDKYARQINLKIQQNFFSNVGKMFNRVCRRDRPFFEEINTSIKQKNGKILLKNLEQSLKQEAIKLGVKYVVGRQIKTFKEAYDLHQHNYPIILDCAGRKSSLRVDQFGQDQKNMNIYNLHYAMHVNFKAIIPKNFDFKLIYPVIKNNQNLKLGEIIVSKNKEKQSKYSHVTVPLFITDQLSEIIDKNYPNINRIPLKPFSLHKQDLKIEKQVSQVINSLFCALVMEDWNILWSTVVLKKINITCGYGIRRSFDRYICLGDSAAHFAYFKSLNFGLKHAYQFVKILSTYHSLQYKLGDLIQKQIVNRCWKKNPLIWPTMAQQAVCPAQYFIVTSNLKLLAPYLYDIRDDSITLLNLVPQISMQKIQKIFKNHKQNEKQKSWQVYLDLFQHIRKSDIDKQIFSNRSKKTGSELISYFIWLNSLSPLKMSQTASLMVNGYYLNKNDFDYFGQMLIQVKSSVQDWKKFSQIVQIKVVGLLNSKKQKIPTEYQQFLNRLKNSCHDKHFNSQQFCTTIDNFNFQNKKKNKQLFLFFKVFKIICQIIQQQVKQQQQKIVQKQEILRQQI